jgi:hypothetical protein
MAELGAGSSASGELCAGGLNWLGGRGACAVAEIGQSRREKTIFHAVRMRRLGRAGVRRSGFTRRDNAFTDALWPVEVGEQAGKNPSSCSGKLLIQFDGARFRTGNKQTR